MEFDYKKKLEDMLCYIHRDGGHYIGKHGIEKAYKDGLKKVLDLIHGDKDESNYRKTNI
jgi:hypothetical protein